MVIEMETTRKIFITGDATGSSELSGTGDIKIVVKVLNALQAQLAKEVLTLPLAKKAVDATHAAASDVASRCTGNSKTATADENGNNIAETYVRKDEMPQFNFEKPYMSITYKGKTYRFVGEEV